MFVHNHRAEGGMIIPLSLSHLKPIGSEFVTEHLVFGHPHSEHQMVNVKIK